MSLHPELVNGLTDLVSAESAAQIAANLGVYVGALAVIVAMAMAIAELVGLVDRFLVERSIRRDRMLRFKGYGKVATIRRCGPRMTVGDRAVALAERKERDND